MSAYWKNYNYNREENNGILCKTKLLYRVSNTGKTKL